MVRILDGKWKPRQMAEVLLWSQRRQTRSPPHSSVASSARVDHSPGHHARPSPQRQTSHRDAAKTKTSDAREHLALGRGAGHAVSSTGLGSNSWRRWSRPCATSKRRAVKARNTADTPALTRPQLATHPLDCTNAIKSEAGEAPRRNSGLALRRHVAVASFLLLLRRVRVIRRRHVAGHVVVLARPVAQRHPARLGPEQPPRLAQPPLLPWFPHLVVVLRPLTPPASASASARCLCVCLA